MYSPVCVAAGQKPGGQVLMMQFVFSSSTMLLYPPQTVFVGGYTVSTLSERPYERPSDRVSVTFCFLNILKNYGWNFIKFCKHIHMY